jgi:hypothetical protein
MFSMVVSVSQEELPNQTVLSVLTLPDAQWKADLAPDKQQFWEPEWQATPALPALTRPKLIPVVTTAAQADAVELALTYFRRWNRPGKMRSEIGSFLSTWIRITDMRKSQE